MGKIKVEAWRGEFYYDQTKVLEAETDGRVLYCLTDARGIKPYSLIRCNAFAETEEGKKVIRIMRGRDEKGRDKEKNLEKSRRIKKN